MAKKKKKAARQGPHRRAERPDWLVRFGAVYARLGNVKAACDELGIGLRTVGDWKEKDQAFREACDDIYRGFMEDIAAGQIKEARDGQEKVEVTYDAAGEEIGRKVTTMRNHNQARFILERQCPDVWGEAVGSTDTPQDQAAKIRRHIAEMRATMPTEPEE